MPDTLSLNLRASLDWLFKEALDLSNVVDASKLEYSTAMADGTGSGQCDKIWHDTRTLASGAADSLDLTALATSLFGANITLPLVKVKAILVKNRATTAGENLTIGGAASAFVGPFGAAAHTIACPADSCVLLINRLTGWMVTDGSADVLKIANAGAGSVTYDIAIVGTSA